MKNAKKKPTSKLSVLPAEGVVVGKFYPYHHGHRHLIKTAADNCRHLTVMVCNQAGQWIPTEERVRWIQESFPRTSSRGFPDENISVRYFDQEGLGLPDTGSERWAEETIRFLGFAPDIVFTSEDYGKPWADAMGAEHRLVDQQRTAVPISGTMIREDPERYLQYLEAPAQEFFHQHQDLLHTPAAVTP